MNLARWGNSYAVRIPADIVAQMGLAEGDELHAQVTDAKTLKLVRQPSRAERVASLRRFAGAMPAGFKFDREEANERPSNAKLKPRKLT